MKKIKKKKKKLILIIIIILIFFLIIPFTINDNRTPTVFEQILKDNLLIINRINLKKNNKSELEENIKKQYIVEIENLKNEINALKEELNLNTILSDYEVINATIINRDLGYFYDTITLDKGTIDGVLENQAVAVSSGLIGKIINTTKHTSTAKLLTNSNSKIQVSVQIKVGDEYLYGILTNYDKEKNHYIVEGITDTGKITIGSFVSTTGMSDIFPSGILIGEVKEITKDNFDLEGIIKVKPSVNFNSINYIKILRRK